VSVAKAAAEPELIRRHGRAGERRQQKITLGEIRGSGLGSFATFREQHE
jgi:hypothetical protein